MAKKKKDSMEKSDDSGDVKVDEKAVVEAAAPVAAGEDEFSPEDEAKYALPMAPIVRMMKTELDKDKMIRRRVKEEMNLFLEKVCKKIARSMNQSEYTVVEVDDFKTAVEPYELIDEVEQERHRIVANLEKIKMDCDSLIMDVNRKFVTPTGVMEQQAQKTGEVGEQS